MRVEFFVPGIAKPAGSKRGFVLQRTGMKPRAIIIDACKTSKDWKADVKAFARQYVNGSLMSGPIALEVYFFMPRPKSHYRTGKRANELRPDAPMFHTGKPDATKLLRAVEDAMTGVAWNDDAQICKQTVEKTYWSEPGARIVIRPCGDDAVSVNGPAYRSNYNPPPETRRKAIR